MRSNVTKETAKYETDVSSSGSNSKQGRSNDAEHTDVTENYKGHMVDYNHDVVRDTMLIPNNINQWGEENYELTGYINDVNTEHTQVLMEYSKSGMVNNIYEYGIQRESMSWYGRKGYYAYDGRGSVADVTGSASQTMIQYKYNNYGETSSLVNGYNNYVRNPYRYNGERTDEVAGVPDQQYLRARYYNANMGRFLTSDTYLGRPHDPLSLSLYAYCGNNPVNAIDPSGHRTEGNCPSYMDPALYYSDDITIYNSQINLVKVNNKKMDRLLIQYNYTRKEKKRPELIKKIEELIKINKELICKIEESKKWLNNKGIKNLAVTPENFVPNYQPMRGVEIKPVTKLTADQKRAYEDASAMANNILYHVYTPNYQGNHPLNNYTLFDAHDQNYRNEMNNQNTIKLFDKILEVGEFCLEVKMAVNGSMQDTGGNKQEAFAAGLAAALQNIAEGNIEDGFGAGTPNFSDLADFLGITEESEQKIAQEYELRQVFTGIYRFYLSDHEELFYDAIDKRIEDIKNTSESKEYKEYAIGYLNSLKAVNLLEDETREDVSYLITQIKDKYRGWSVTYG